MTKSTYFLCKRFGNSWRFVRSKDSKGFVRGKILRNFFVSRSYARRWYGSCEVVTYFFGWSCIAIISDYINITVVCVSYYWTRIILNNHRLFLSSFIYSLLDQVYYIGEKCNKGRLPFISVLLLVFFPGFFFILLNPTAVIRDPAFQNCNSVIHSSYLPLPNK